MKHIAQSLTLALAALAVSTSAPRAGEWVGSGGVIKDYRGAAVPVPAPRPAPIEKAEWYLRGDVGYLIANHQEYKFDGPTLSSGNDDAGGAAFGGIGFGRYLSPGWRVDFTTDFKPKRRVQKANGVYADVVSDGTTVTTYAVTQADSGSITNYAGMVNVYRDLERHGAITPYFGLGVGFATQQLQYSVSRSVACVQDFDIATAVTTLDACSVPTQPNGAGSKGTITWGFAAAAIAGFTLDVMPGVKMDSSYRLMYEGVTGSVKNVADSRTKFTVTDGLEHALRTGIRIDLN